MFLFRWIKNLILLGMLAVGLWWASGYFKYQGKTYQEWAIQLYRSPSLIEASKDLRIIFGQFLQGAGKKIQEGVTVEDQKKLDAIIQGDLVKRGASESSTVKSSPLPVKK